MRFLGDGDILFAEFNQDNRHAFDPRVPPSRFHPVAEC